MRFSYTSMPFKKTASLMNSLLSCNRIGVLVIGENPKHGIPLGLKYLISVEPGEILGKIFNPLKTIT